MKKSPPRTTAKTAGQAADGSASAHIDIAEGDTIDEKALKALFKAAAESNAKGR